MVIQALPEAQVLWADPEELIRTWAYQPEKETQEHFVRDWLGPCGRLADLGCGSGRYARVLDYDSYWGFDQSVAMIAHAQELATELRRFSVADIFNFEPGVKFNTVLLLDVAIHQNAPVEAILRILDLWRADRFVFSLLIGNETQRLLNTTVVSGDDAHVLLREVARMHVEQVKDEAFVWYLVEIRK